MSVYVYIRLARQGCIRMIAFKSRDEILLLNCLANHIFFHNQKKETNAMNNAIEVIKTQTIVTINGRKFEAQIMSGPSEHDEWFDSKEDNHGENK